MSNHKIKNIEVIRSLAKIEEIYEPVSFIAHKWQDQRILFLSTIETDYEEIYLDALQDPVTKEYNITEYLFEMAKDFPGLFFCSATLVSKKEAEIKISSKLILNNKHRTLSSDDIFDMYKSACLFSKIGYPKVIEMSYSSRKRKICPNESLLDLSHVEIC